jgi:hypothetical protein
MTDLLTIDKGDIKKIKKYLHVVKEEPSKSFPGQVDVIVMAETLSAAYWAGRETPTTKRRA